MTPQSLILMLILYFCYYKNINLNSSIMDLLMKNIVFDTCCDYTINIEDFMTENSINSYQTNETFKKFECLCFENNCVKYDDCFVLLQKNKLLEELKEKNKILEAENLELKKQADFLKQTFTKIENHPVAIRQIENEAIKMKNQKTSLSYKNIFKAYKKWANERDLFSLVTLGEYADFLGNTSTAKKKYMIIKSLLKKAGPAKIEKIFKTSEPKKQKSQSTCQIQLTKLALEKASRQNWQEKELLLFYLIRHEVAVKGYAIGNLLVSSLNLVNLENASITLTKRSNIRISAISQELASLLKDYITERQLDENSNLFYPHASMKDTSRYDCLHRRLRPYLKGSL